MKRKNKIVLFLTLAMLSLCSVSLAEDVITVGTCEEGGVVQKSRYKKRNKAGKQYAVLHVQAPRIREYTFECTYMMKDSIFYDEVHNQATIFVLGGNCKFQIFHPDCNKKIIELPPLKGNTYYDLPINIKRDGNRLNFKDLERTIEGEFTYRVPAYVSVDEAYGLVIERAQIDAMAHEFGTVKARSSKDNDIDEIPSVVDPDALHGTDVRGRKMNDIDAPKVKSAGKYAKTGDRLYKVKLNFRARELTRMPVEMDIKVLRNSTDEMSESTDFRHGDKMYLSFQSQSDGWLLVYLMDNSGGVFNLVPHWESSDRIKSIKGREQYILLSANHASKEERSVPRGVELTCADKQLEEDDCLFFIFSPKKFDKLITKASDGKSASAVSDLSYAEFRDWIEQLRTYDDELHVYQQMIKISQK